MSEQLTVLDVIKKSSDFLEKRGVENSRLDSELLIGHALGLDRMKLYVQFDRPLKEEELEVMRKLVAQRGKREPLQYIVGQVEFHDLALKVDSRALIPRPETEQLVELVFEAYPEIDDELSILDLGTGSGAIALSLAMKYPRAKVKAVDIDESALELAKENALQTGLQTRVEFTRSRWFEGIEPSEKFDIIISNPPYLTDSEVASAEPEVREHEPNTALVSNDQGFADLSEIIMESHTRLESSGTLWLETGIEHKERLLQACQETGYGEAKCTNDWSGRQRFLKAVRA